MMRRFLLRQLPILRCKDREEFQRSGPKRASTMEEIAAWASASCWKSLHSVPLLTRGGRLARRGVGRMDALLGRHAQGNAVDHLQERQGARFDHVRAHG